MIRYQEAIHIIEETALQNQMGVEIVGTGQALGRITVEKIVSPEEVPHFTNTSMDGFAVFSKNTVNASQDNPIRLPVHGVIAAGDSVAYEIASANKEGTTVEIMTGAPIPLNGYDAVAKIEDVKVIRNGDKEVREIEIYTPLKPFENIRKKGTDYQIGQIVIEKNAKTAPEHILALTSLGICEIKVRKKPKIMILSTGSELVDYTEKNLPPGFIRNSTGPFLISAFQNMGLEASFLGTVKDDPAEYESKLKIALNEGADIIISTGAVSMGKYDFIPDVLSQMGAKTFFHKVAIRPGKPILFAQFQNSKKSTSFFGIPGNPISTTVGFRFFLDPYIRAVYGLNRETPLKIKLNHEFEKSEGLRCFFKAKTVLNESIASVEALKGQASYIVSSLVDANGWVVFAEEKVKQNTVDVVDVYPLQHSFEKGVFD